jgi:hypothetical protein
MTELVRFATDDGAALIVEVSERDFGTERVSRSETGVVEASETLDAAVASLVPSLKRVADGLRKLAPDRFEIEFGIKLNAEAGVIVAKTAAESHFVVKLAWARADTPE